MTPESILILAVAVPTVGCFILPILSRLSLMLRNVVALLLVGVPLVCSLFLLPMVAGGGTSTVSVDLPLGLNFVLRADGLAVFMAIVSALISSIVVIYSWSYISHYEHQTEYYLMVVLFIGAMMGLVYSGNLILLYVFWEITALASWRLIGFFRGKEQVIRADKAFLVTAFGALAMLLGFVMLYGQTNSFDLVAIKNVMQTTPLAMLPAMLILLGILSKSATLPFHTWLPDAGVAPSPVTALLHAAVLVKIGVYVYARLFLVTFSLTPQAQEIVLIIAAASVFVSAGAALIETDLKRIIAFSTISQIAFIFLGLAVGGPIGIAGALIYILMHGLAKGGLFLCAGIVEQNMHTKDIRQMGGLIKTMPVTAVSFLFCSFSVMGIPPFGGFFGKYLVIRGAIETGHFWMAALFMGAACLTILYLLRMFNLIFMGEAKTPPKPEASHTMVACVATLAGLSLLAGFFIFPIYELTETFVQQMLGIVK